MAEDADQPGLVRHRRIHAQPEELRRTHLRLLRRRPAFVGGKNAERLHAKFPTAIVQAVPRPGDAEVPVRESAGEEVGALGPGADGGEDEGVQVVNPRADGRVRVSWSGRRTTTCGIPNPWACEKTRKRRR
jgi:hypothetical protein